MKVVASLVLAALSPAVSSHGSQQHKFGEGAPMAMAPPSYNEGVSYMDTLFTCVEEYQVACFGHDFIEDDWAMDEMNAGRAMDMGADGQERRLLEGELLVSQEGLIPIADKAPQPQPDDGEARPEPFGRADHAEQRGGGRGAHGKQGGPRGQRPGRPDRAEQQRNSERPDRPHGGMRGGRGGRRRTLHEEPRKFSNCPSGSFEHLVGSLSPECGTVLYKLAAFSMTATGEKPGHFLGNEDAPRDVHNVHHWKNFFKGGDDHDDRYPRYFDDDFDDEDVRNVHHWKNFFKGGDDHDDRHPRYFDDDFDDEDEHHFPRILILGAIVACGVYGYRRYSKRGSQAEVETAQSQHQPFQGVHVGNGQPQIATGAPIVFLASAPAAHPDSKPLPGQLPAF